MTDEKRSNTVLQSGQAMVEYALIAVLVILAFAFVLAATAPVVGNIFSNTVINILDAETPLPEGYFPKGSDFWGTVTAVFLITPQEFALPTRTPAPPTKTPTPGPSPTNTPITPTNTPLPTKTPLPTSTPSDKAFNLPFHDSANQPADWRLDSSAYLGSEGWRGSYYPNTNLSGQPDFVKTNKEIDPQYEFDINFLWGSGGPLTNWPAPAANNYNNFSVIWRRPIYIENKTTLRFDIPIMDDGVRIWILGQSEDGTINYGGNTSPTNGGPGNCSDVFSGPTRITTGVAVTTNNDYTDSDYGYNPATSPDTAIPGNNKCLIYDSWQGQNSSRYGITRTVKPGNYLLQVEYYDGTGNANFNLDITSASKTANPDDRVVDAAGNPTTGTPLCQWGQAGGTSYLVSSTNTKDWMWDEYVGGDIPTFTRCYLELRGYVDVPASVADPILSFWDIWDFQNANLEAWVEINEYIQLPGTGGGADRVQMLANGWRKVPLHTGSTTNYNWTYQHIDIDQVMGYDMSGKKLAFRFVMQAKNHGGAVRRWFVDDIHIDNSAYKSFYFAQSWNMDTVEQKADFITSGRWEQTSRNARGTMSWEDSPGASDGAPGSWPYTTYNAVSIAPNNSNYPNLRHHTIEFNGYIDVNDPLGLTDQEGDASDPMLSFWHAYWVNDYTGLEIQYTTSLYSAGNGAVWNTVPGGTLRSRTQTGEDKKTGFKFVEVPLDGMITQIRTSLGLTAGQPTPKFRLRFTMTTQVAAEWVARDGWWVDDIKLERKGAPKYTNYPYYDPVETPHNDWLAEGTWARIIGGAFDPDGYSYADSPDGNYNPSSETSLRLNYPMDLKLDSPTNPKSPSCNLGALCQAPQTSAPINENPIMTFWHVRMLSGGEDFYVEWRRVNAPDTSWTTLWAYRSSMATRTASPSSRTQMNTTWERVEVDLKPMIANVVSTDGAPTDDDDILIRIRFKTDSGSTNDGLYIDDVRIENRVERWWALWPAGSSRVDGSGNTVVDKNGTTVLGNGIDMLESIDNSGAFLDRWYVGGEWRIQDFDRRKGLYAFHDSNGSTPTGQLIQTESPPYNATALVTQQVNSFNVVEMGRIIDLRGVELDEQPILYFWSRYYVRSSDRLRVEVSYEDSSLGALCSSGYAQCYEHQLGWSEWTNVFEIVADRRTYTWQREQVALDPYKGKRIRIRFVSDNLDGDTGNEDGWYIDEVQVKFYEPRIFTLPFFDGARNMQNWVGEGFWGLDPEFFRGAGGGPASLGTSTWNAYYWDVNSCPKNSNFGTCVSTFLNGKTNATADRTTLYLDLNLDFGWNGPFLNWLRGCCNIVDYFAARYELLTPTVDGVSVSPGTYTFVAISDNGVRMKYETSPTGFLPAPITDDPPIYSDNYNAGNATGWNVINNFSPPHGRTVDMGSARLVAGRQYKFTVEYYDYDKQAAIIVTTGSNNFSFHDTPKQGTGPSFPDVAAIPRSNSSLILDGVLDLTGKTAPLIQYYTYFELNGSARFEVTTDGGFNWTQTGLVGTLPAGYWNNNWTGTYFNNKTLANPVAGTRNDGNSTIDFNFGNGSPGIGGIGGDNFSVRWTRSFTIPAGLTIPVTFRTRSDDGVRLWLNYANGCFPGVNSGQAKTGDSETYPDPETHCLLIDDWEDQGGETNTAVRTLGPGTYTLQLDYYENGGGASVRLDVETAAFGAFVNPNYGSATYMPTDGDWLLRQHDLSAYAGQQALGMRFRLDMLSTDSEQRTNQTPTNWKVGWWLADITVLDP